MPHLDPDWTPERGYAHALGLLAICLAAEAALAAEGVPEHEPGEDAGVEG